MVRIEVGGTIVIPAQMGSFALEPDRQVRLIKSWVPDLWDDTIEPLRSKGVENRRIGTLGGPSLHNDLRKLLV